MMIHASHMMIGLNVECYKTDQDALDRFQRLQCVCALSHTGGSPTSSSPRSGILS